MKQNCVDFGLISSGQKGEIIVLRNKTFASKANVNQTSNGKQKENISLSKAIFFLV